MKTFEGYFVDGAWRPSSRRETAEILNPATEEVCGVYDVATAEDVDAAVQSARRALKSAPWSTMPLEERIAIVLRIRERLVALSDGVAELTATFLGQPFAQARGLGGALEFLDMYVEAIHEVQFEYRREDKYGRSLVERRPVGVVAAIAPWNTPMRSEVKKVVPALLTGCTVVMKPAPQTLYAAALLAEAAVECGLPAGVLNVVMGGAEVGKALVEHPLVNKVAFTGSTATGRWIGSVCGQQMKRVQLELGGKSAAILLDDADIAKALPHIVMPNFRNAGQACVATTRILAPRSMYDEVCDALVAAARSQVLGDPFDAATTVGPVVTSHQRDRVEGYIKRGQGDGAKLLTGGRRPAGLDRGWFVEPTVFSDVENKMVIAQEEIFGPVASVLAYDDVDDAVEIANDSVYGLHGTVFSADDDRALAVARRVDSGTMGVNRFGFSSSTPFGGVKLSGIGREHGPEGFDSFLEYHAFGLP